MKFEASGALAECGSVLDATVLEAAFYGIAIAMYCNDHNPPHFHAQYGQSRAVIGIAGGRIIAGSLPPTALRLVREWALAHQAELDENWANARADRPLERIPGPDDD